MKKLILKTTVIAIIFLLFTKSSFAQYNLIECDKINPSFQIVQIDFTEVSTLIFFKYTNTLGDGAWMNFGDNTYLRDPKSEKMYKLLNSVNMPINEEGEPKRHVFDKIGQKHNFCLEFEKLPGTIEKFDLIEEENNPNAFNFYGIRIDKKVNGELVNVNDFIMPTPVKEYGANMRDGNLIL